MLCLFASVLLSCANHYAGNIDNGGSASEVEGKYAVKGTVVYDCGEPVPGAKVRMRPHGFLALYADKFVAYDTTTDEQGRFYFDTALVDSYTIEINKNGKYGALEQLVIGTKDTFPIVLSKATLVPTGSIAGRINLPISDDTVRPYIAIYNVDYMAKALITQDFRFDGIPQGGYNLRLVPSLRSKFVMELRDIEVVGDSVVDLGTLTLFALDFFKGCAGFECDSVVVRSILDANGLTDVSVFSVVTIDSATGRVVGLDLSGRSIATLTKDIGSLSQLVTLNLRNNHLVSIPSQICYLRGLEYCYLDSNELYELPAGFCYCKSMKVLTASNNRISMIGDGIVALRMMKLDLRNNRIEFLPEGSALLPAVRFLYLDNNELQSLPIQIDKQIFPEELSMGFNCLCAMPETIVAWLAGYDKDWQASQKCR